MARRSDHSREELREMALCASEEILASQGSAALTTRAVARRIGYTVGTLYHLFENLDDLILQLNARTLDELSEFLHAELQKAVEPANTLEKLRLLTHAYLDFARRRSERWMLLFEYRLKEEKEVPVWFQAKVDRLFHILEQILTPECKQASQARLAARTLWSSVHGICILALGNKLGSSGQVSVQAVLDSLVENYLLGLINTSNSGKQDQVVQG